MTAKTLGVLLGVTMSAVAAPSGAAQEITVTEASNGVNRSFDERIKSKSYGPANLTWGVLGSFPAGSERSIECFARMFDGTTAQGFGKRRSGVKVTLSGAVLDEAGKRLQALAKQSGTTDKQGEVTIRYALGDFENFVVSVDASFKKKKITAGLVSCSVASDAAEARAISPGRVAARSTDPSEEISFATVRKQAEGPTKLSNWEPVELDFVARVQSDSVLDCFVALTADGGNRRTVKDEADFEVVVEDPSSGEEIATASQSSSVSFDDAGQFLAEDLFRSVPNNTDLRFKTSVGLTGKADPTKITHRCSARPDF